MRPTWAAWRTLHLLFAAAATGESVRGTLGATPGFEGLERGDHTLEGSDAPQRSSPPKFNPNLKYFSVWHVGAGAVEDADADIDPSFVNFFFDVQNLAAFEGLRRRGFGPSLLDVEQVLFWPRSDKRAGLRPDYLERWNATVEMLRPFVLDGSAMGVFLGDELAWNCVSYKDLSTAAALVRATLPPVLPARLGLARPVVYYNEAYPVFDDVALWNETCGPDVALAGSGGGYGAVPSDIDWISMDYYPNEGTFAGARRIYRDELYPRLASHQRVLFVPPGYGCSAGSDAAFVDKWCCNNNTRDGANPSCGGDCEAAMSEWARDAYDWARSDEHFVGINPWHWYQRGAPSPASWPPNTQHEPGLKWLTKSLRPLYERIGREIVSGRQGDVGADAATLE